MSGATLSVIGRSLEIAAELVRVKVDVMVVGTDLAIAAVKRQTRSIPIVMDEILDSVRTFVIEYLTRDTGPHRRQATPWL